MPEKVIVSGEPVKDKETPSKAEGKATEKDIKSKVDHDVRVMSIGSKHPDHNPAKGVIVQTPSKEVIEDARVEAQRKHETGSAGPPDWRDLPDAKGKTWWQLQAEKEEEK
jgi:hypothetical protein